MNIEEILMRAQTYAFCSLALSELFHAIGMRDTNNSIFKFNWLDNKTMLIALAVGFGSQVLVTEVPFLMGMFGTVGLSFVEWVGLLGVSTLPLVVHEVIILYKHL